MTTADLRIGADLLEVADHWCEEGRRLGAEFAQAFVEATSDLRLESTAHGRIVARGGTTLERRYGVGLLLRHRGSWWYGSAPLAEPGELATRLATIPGLSSPRAPRPWRRADPPAALCPEWDGMPTRRAATGLSVGTGRTRVDFVQDFFRQQRALADSAGTRQTWRVSGGRQRCTATVVADGTEARSFTRRSRPHWGVAGSAEELAASAEDLADSAVARARSLAEARSLGTRTTPVVFAPSVGAALLHELVGHALEADNFARNSPYTAGLTGAMLCDAPLELVDDPTVSDGIGSRDIDDDGQACAPTALVRQGTVVGQLSCIRCSYGTAGSRGGNGRRQGYRHASLPRASNTVVLPGQDSSCALAEPPPEGLLYVAALSSGEINQTRGEFCFSAAESYYLTRHGDPRPLRDVNFSGGARDALRRLAGIASNVQGDNVTCGKQGQSVHIGLYSPTMRFDRLTWWS